MIMKENSKKPNKNSPLKIDVELEKALDVLVFNGEALAACPKCNTFLSYEERDECVCDKCNISFKASEILYYPGADKENN